MIAGCVSTSYEPSDVRFLLEPIELAPLSIDDRERAIARGRHYSEMIGTEDAPDLERVRIFRDAVAANGRVLASALLVLADRLRASVSDRQGHQANRELVIASIARAGTPIGVILARWMRMRFPSLQITHYSISVIRDRGVDRAALARILERHPIESIRFVDGWTGKGTIADELHASVPARQLAGLDSGLWVPLDVCGAARVAATGSDFLLPHAVLGGTISGLVSRSILPATEVGAMRLHRCVRLQNLGRYDLSRWYAGHMVELMREVHQVAPAPICADWSSERAATRRRETRDHLERLRQEQGVQDVNRLKLGIGETVRVLLRRRPRLVMLDATARAADSALVRRLAALRGLEPAMTRGSPFASTAIIDELKS